jgi:hypothetical protein
MEELCFGGVGSAFSATLLIMIKRRECMDKNKLSRDYLSRQHLFMWYYIIRSGLAR